MTSAAWGLSWGRIMLETTSKQLEGECGRGEEKVTWMLGTARKKPSPMETSPWRIFAKLRIFSARFVLDYIYTYHIVQQRIDHYWCLKLFATRLYYVFDFGHVPSVSLSHVRIPLP